ncbi:uncharacterized protein LOC115364651 [Myripristis murdjan]|uniref:uncharacterized protein LOC115364651 n=1 Tax=Myripristis murdjan TaxID=586833 RepID=UPI001175CB6E|nr:uncharacterized protein LOC115364651 [Myripristis murdjan]XP_029915155.1 uncharacterized protein LOC115364651 [Myripristis murdjan]
MAVSWQLSAPTCVKGCQRLRPPPAGQQRRLQLKAVNAQTLLKLVGLLYSGKLEVKGSLEQRDVLAAAHLLGIRDLAEEWRERWTERDVDQPQQRCSRCRERDMSTEEQRARDKSRRRDAQVQAGMVGKRDTETQVEMRGCASMWTQTVEVANSFTLPFGIEPPTPKPVSTVAQRHDNIHITSPQHSPDCVTSLASSPVLSSDDITSPISSSKYSNYPRAQEDSTCLQLSVLENSTGVFPSGSTGNEDENDGQTDERRNKGEQSLHALRDDTRLEEKREKLLEMRSSGMGVESLAKKKPRQMVGTAQISIKVKLKRMTTGEAWQVVSMQDTNETSPVNKETVLAVLKQDGSKPTVPQRDLTQVEPHPSTSHTCQIHEPETPVPESDATNASKPPPEPSTTSEPQPTSSDPCVSKPNCATQSTLLPQLQGSVEESDEQIEKLLEDIMMSLNILPTVNLDRNCNSSDHLQPSHDGAPATCQVPTEDCEVRQSQMDTTVNTAGCVYYHGLETGNGDTSSTNTGVGRSSTDQNLPNPTSSSSQPAILLNQEQQHSPQCHSSIRYAGQRGRMSCQGTSLCRTQDCLYTEAHRSRSAGPMVYHSIGQELHYPTCQESSSREEQCLPECLPQSHGNEALSFSGSLPCIEDLRLPRCLSPLQPCASAVEHHPVPKYFADNCDKMLPQSQLMRLSWLSSSPRALQFPLSTMVHKEKTYPPLSQDTRNSCLSKQSQQHIELNPGNVESCTESCSENEVEEKRVISGATQNVGKTKPDCKKMKESLKSKWKQFTNARHTLAPRERKRKRTNYSRDAVSPVLGCKEVKISDGTNSTINLSVCSVSLSSNNVLAKDREMATNSGNMPSSFAEEPDKLSTMTENLRESAKDLKALTKSTVVNADQTRIRTRSFMRKTTETTRKISSSDVSAESPVAPSPMAQSCEFVSEVEVPRRKRGRPPMIRFEDLSLPGHAVPITDNKSYNEERKQKISEYKRPKKLKEDKPKKQRNRKRDKSVEVQAIPRNMAQDAFTPGQTSALWGIPAQSLQESCQDTSRPQLNADSKLTLHPECAGEVNADKDTVVSPVDKLRATKSTKPRVSLKAFQNLIKRRHLKTKNSKENENKKNSHETAKNLQSERRACDETDSTYKELEKDVDIAPTQCRDGIKTSDVNCDVAFDKNQNQVFITETHGSQKDDRHTQIIKEGPWRQEQNKVTSKSEKENESSTNELKVLDTVSDTLDRKYSTLEGIKDYQMTVTDSRRNGYMRMSPVRATEELEEEGSCEQSVAGKADTEVDFSSEKFALFPDEDHSVSYFPDPGQLSEKIPEEDNIDVGEEEVAKIANERGVEKERSLQNPNTALQINNAESPAVTDEGFTNSDSSLLLENNMTSRTPQRIHQPWLDFWTVSMSSEWGQEDEEEMEVDVLVCSPDKVLQTKECGVGSDVMVLSPEEEEEEIDVTEIDVTGD